MALSLLSAETERRKGMRTDIKYAPTIINWGQGRKQTSPQLLTRELMFTFLGTFVYNPRYNCIVLPVRPYRQKTLCLQAKDLAVTAKRLFACRQKPVKDFSLTFPDFTRHFFFSLTETVDTYFKVILN